MDFVAHGESGLASAWILNAKAGDKIGVSMWNAAIELYPVADWYLLAGDATGIPVLSVILETLPATAKGVVIIEVHGPEDEQELHTRADIEMRWLYNASPENGSNLAAEVRSIHIPSVESSTRFGYVAAEFSSVKGIREYLRKEQAWKREELYAYSYWKAGVSEDGSGKDRDAEYAGDR
jgi:NADPH-dependent ferric siderophore reductase